MVAAYTKRGFAVSNFWFILPGLLSDAFLLTTPLLSACSLPLPHSPDAKEDLRLAKGGNLISPLCAVYLLLSD